MYLVQCLGSTLFATELLLTDRRYAKCSKRCTNSVSKIALKIFINNFLGLRSTIGMQNLRFSAIVL